jgi:GNAT superfamily N-acetyltransferase
MSSILKGIGKKVPSGTNDFYKRNDSNNSAAILVKHVKAARDYLGRDPEPKEEPEETNESYWGGPSPAQLRFNRALKKQQNSPENKADREKFQRELDRIMPLPKKEPEDKEVTEGAAIPLSGKTDSGYNWKFEAGREVPWKTDVEANTFVRVTDPDGKTVAGVWADLEGDSLAIEYSQVFDDELRGRGLYTDLLKSLSKLYDVTSDTDTNNAAAGIYKRLGADYDAGQARHTLRKQGVAEGTNVDVGGIRLNVAVDGAEVIIRPIVDEYQAGYAVFDRDGSTLVPADLAIDEEFRGQGIAKIIYDYVKSLGFAIRRSSDQTRAGKHFWDKNRGEGSQVWEEELDEACWKGYHKKGMKTMFGKRYPNCVKNTKEDIEEDHRIARKPGQPANSKKHSDLYTDENPKGTIHGLKFATVDDAHASVAKIKSSGRSHAHKIQAAVAMEQRARAAGKASAAAVYRSYINGAKKTNESTEESCPHCNGPMFSEEMINEKKDACYYKVKSRYKVWPSAYASGALVQCRKKGASNWGTKSESSILEGLEQTDEDLHKWFKEKWVRFGPDGKIRGACARGGDSEGKPKCLPQSKAQNLGKKGRASAASRKRREDPDPERSGKAINVATKKKTTESSILQGIRETKGLPMSGSYEQEYGPFKNKGGYRIMTLTSEQEELDEKWSNKYKRSIDCSHPKGFSQRAHCQGKKKK